MTFRLFIDSALVASCTQLMMFVLHWWCRGCAVVKYSGMTSGMDEDGHACGLGASSDRGSGAAHLQAPCLTQLTWLSPEPHEGIGGGHRATRVARNLHVVAAATVVRAGPPPCRCRCGGT